MKTTRLIAIDTRQSVTRCKRLQRKYIWNSHEPIRVPCVTELSKIWRLERRQVKLVITPSEIKQNV